MTALNEKAMEMAITTARRVYFDEHDTFDTTVIRALQAYQAAEPDAGAVERRAIDDLIFDLAAHHQNSASSWDQGACDFADKVREAIRARSQP